MFEKIIVTGNKRSACTAKWIQRNRTIFLRTIKVFVKIGEQGYSRNLDQVNPVFYQHDDKPTSTLITEPTKKKFR